ncbi:MAG: maltotransferase domain-containing protein, partial [Burkholderiales bacterium]
MSTPNRTRDGRGRVVIDRVRPEVDGGRFPIKRTVGEQVIVSADVFADGHDVIRCLVRHRPEGADKWTEVSMEASYNDLWQASFTVNAIGRHVYTVVAWVDRFFTWQHDLARRNDPKDIALAMKVGEELVLEAAARAPGAAGARLKEIAATLGKTSAPETAKQLGADRELTELMSRHAEQRFPTEYERVLTVTVEPVRA